MVFNAAKMTISFINGPQIDLYMDISDWLAQQLVVVVEGFEYFKSDQLYEAIKNLRMTMPGILYQLDTNGGVLVP